MADYERTQPVPELTRSLGRTRFARTSTAGYGDPPPLPITSNLAFGDWDQVFLGERMTAALLDPLTHRCHIFEINGESYRSREPMKTNKCRKSE